LNILRKEIWSIGCWKCFKSVRNYRIERKKFLPSIMGNFISIMAVELRLPYSVGRDEEGIIKHAEIFSHNSVQLRKCMPSQCL